jgi:hypothetical protein
MKQQFKRFFNNPYEFSFKDFIALIFISMFLYVTYKALTSSNSLEVMKSLIPIIMVIISFYFGQEVATAYFQSKYPNQYGYYNGYYNGYYGNYQQYTQYPQQETQEEAEQQQINQTNTPSI